MSTGFHLERGDICNSVVDEVAEAFDETILVEKISEDQKTQEQILYLTRYLEADLKDEVTERF